MAQQAKHFDYSTGDIEAFLENVTGISILYRNKMRAILKSEDNEMPRMKELFTEMVQMKEDRGNGPMRDDFAAGFIKIFNMNAAAKDQIAE